MTPSSRPDAPCANQILNALPAPILAGITPHLERVHLPLGQVLCEAGETLDHAYFPEGSVVSMMTVMEDGTQVECANIGCEGMLGVFSGIHNEPSSMRCLVQLPGPAARIDMDLMRQTFHADRTVRDLLIRYSETIVSQLSQTVACNALHSVEQRICRWLLMMHDRAQDDRLPYTHEFMSEMIAANRTSVTHAAQSLQRRGFITYCRGQVRIKDRAAMQAAACECYQAVQDQFRRCLSHPGHGVPRAPARPRASGQGGPRG